MTVYVFSGPTLNAEEARGEIDAVCLPPVAQGDVYRAALRRPRAIGIIDGLFERVPAVWHKEILWAMSQGIHVFGSASMGALRAAELAAFGMEGIGAIFEAYRDGMIEDDDEVAVAHGPAETGFAACSEAMVNIRATLAGAEAGGVISHSTRFALEGIAKEAYYPDRSYALLMTRGMEQGVPAAELDALRDWLPARRIDQKREDALAMLREMRVRLDAGLTPKRASFVFERSGLFAELQISAGTLETHAEPGAEMLLTEWVIDELRLDREAYAVSQRDALLRVYGNEIARVHGLVVSTEHLTDTAAAFRRERNLFTTRDLDEWLARHHLDQDQFVALVEQEARLRWLEHATRFDAVVHLADQLRVSGAYEQLAERAQDKRRTLEVSGLLQPTLRDAGCTEEELMRWYFEQRLGRPVPDDLDAYAEAAGFQEADILQLAVLREYCYVQTRSIGRDGAPAAPAVA